jgi:hypothetical protein
MKSHKIDQFVDKSWRCPNVNAVAVMMWNAKYKVSTEVSIPLGTGSAFVTRTAKAATLTADNVAVVLLDTDDEWPLILVTPLLPGTLAKLEE